MPLPATPPAHSSPQAPASAVIRPLTLSHPLGDSFLYVPPECRNHSCPLIVISHTRGKTALQLTQSPFVQLYLQAFLARGFAVLYSNDAGPRSWGGPAALTYLGEVQAEAVRRFLFNGHSYAFGISMGGLAALRSALLGPYPVRGVALLDAHANLNTALHDPSDSSRQAEVAAAYGLSVRDIASPEEDPLSLIQTHALPLFVVGSPDDVVVPFKDNGEAIYPHAALGLSQRITLQGPHLGGSHFAPQLVAQLADFFVKLEQVAAVENPSDTPSDASPESH